MDDDRLFDIGLLVTVIVISLMVLAALSLTIQSEIP